MYIQNSQTDSCELIELFEGNYCFEIYREKNMDSQHSQKSVDLSSLISNISNVDRVLECIKIGIIGIVV